MIYEEYCDTCDSKNNKTPVNARVRVRAREGDYRYFCNSFIAVHILLLLASISLQKNDLSFCEKQAVIL